MSLSRGMAAQEPGRKTHCGMKPICPAVLNQTYPGVVFRLAQCSRTTLAVEPPAYGLQPSGASTY
jgi:hypothetical protein